MKEYFLQLLNNLDKVAGLRQVEKIMTSSENPKQDINNLLMILCAVCAQFPTIPDEDKKQIIDAAVITDPEFNSLNARIIYKWLSAKRDKYPAPIQEEERDPTKDYTPVTPEQEREWFKKWKLAIEAVNDHMKIKPTERMEAARIPRQQYKPVNPEELHVRDLIHKVAGDFYKGLHSGEMSRFKYFSVSGYDIYARDERDAKNILARVKLELSERSATNEQT